MKDTVMITYNPIELPPYGGHITNIAPFTYRDGWTYAKLLERVASELERVVDDINDYLNRDTSEQEQQLNDIVDQINDELSNFVDVVNNALTDQTDGVDTKILQLENYVDAAVQSIIESSLTVQDAIVSQAILDESSDTRQSLDSVYVSQNSLDGEVSEHVSNNSSLTRALLDNTYQTINTVSDSAVADVIDNIASATSAVLDARYQNKLVINVKDYGAVADGLTDNTVAVQAAMNAAENKTLYFPPGDYLLDGYVKLVSNVSIIGADGAILRKRAATKTSYVCFASLSGENMGYGSGARNVYAAGLTFRGDFTPGQVQSVCGFALHHAANMVFENLKWIEARSGGHAFDLNGCENIHIKNCLFEGYYSESETMYNECIQIDNSNKRSVSVKDVDGYYDGLMTRNVIIENNKWKGLVKDTTVYGTDVPVGSHGVVQGRYYENIVFRNNVIDGVKRLLNDGSASARLGILHFVGVKNLFIYNNVFNQTESHESYAITVNMSVKGKPLANVNSELAEVAIPNQTCHNIQIVGNVFKGFKIGALNAAVISMNVGEDELENKLEGGSIVISNNEFINDSPAVYLFGGQNISFSQNSVKGSRVLSVNNCDQVTISNNNSFGHSASAAYLIDNTYRATVTGNTCLGSGVTFTTARGDSKDIIVSNNTTHVIDVGSAIAMSGVVRAVVVGNIVRGSMSYGIRSLVGGSTVIANNLVQGATSDATRLDAGVSGINVNNHAV